MLPVAAYACSAAAVVAGTFAARALFAPRSEILGPVLWRGDPDAGPRVALTFDDGPWPGVTEPILAALAGARAKATFFVIGRYAATHPDLLRRIRDEGHQIGNHTYNHDRTGLFRGRRYWIDQVRRTDDAIERAVGAWSEWFRPPMGFKSPPLVRAAAGHRVVAWSRRARDGTTTTPGRIVQRLAPASAGDILLLHDGRDPFSRRDPGVTVAALPRVLANLAARGLQSVRVDELCP